MLKFAAATAAASKKRKEAEARGQHIPSFLIASITSQCNLHCAGGCVLYEKRDLVEALLAQSR